MKEGLEANHVKRHQEEVRKMREGRESDHEKRMREAVKQARAEILCATLQHRLEAMRKDHKRLTRKALESMRY